MADAASVTDEPQAQSEGEQLKHLGFVEDAIQQVVDYASKAYDYAKDITGPLKPGVETIETTVKTVVGPVYEKFHDVPGGVLKFVDRKALVGQNGISGEAFELYDKVMNFPASPVDESVTQLDGVLPTVVKDVTITAKNLSTDVVSDVKKVGVVGTAKELLVKIEPVAEEYASSAWKTLNHLPLVASIVKALKPSATFVTEKYNETVEKNAPFLPLVPTEKISRVFSIPEPEAGEPEPAVVPGGEEEAAEEVAVEAEEVVEEAAA